MVVLAAAVVSKSGEPILSRQFRDIPRSRIEGLLATFPKIRPTSSQHTMCENDSVRYLYHSLDDHHLMLLITNRASNILQDLGTLQLFVRVVADVCPPRGGLGGGGAGGWSRSDLRDHALELAEAFDECVTVGGYRENVTSIQVAQTLEMDSHEERIQEIIARNKEKEVKEEGKRRAKELNAQRREQAKKGLPVSASSTGGFGASAGGMTSYRTETSNAVPEYGRESPVAKAVAPKGKGMQLGKKKTPAAPDADIYSAVGLGADDDNAVVSTTAPAFSSSYEPEDKPAYEPIHVEVEERINAVANRDGGLDAFECRGALILHVSTPELARLRLSLNTTAVDANTDVQFKLHPNMDKKTWASDRVIQLKDLARGFPVNQGLAVVKWRMVGKDESALPLIINCWPQVGDGSCDVNIEYELEHDLLEFDEVTITVPIPAGTKPEIGECDGLATFDRSRSVIEWSTPRIDKSTKTGSLEFTIPEGADDADAFFPVEVSFRASGLTYSGIAVTGCRMVEGNEDAEFGLDVVVAPDEYSVV